MRYIYTAFLVILAAAACCEGDAGVYSRRWSRGDFEETIRLKDSWLNNDIGKGEYAPPPWTPMEVKGKNIACWGRVYIYDNSILPAQVVSAGKELFAERPVFVLHSADERLVFDEASVEIEMVHSGLVKVSAMAHSGPYTLRLDKEYEFDGMAKISLSLSGEQGCPPVDGFFLEFPLRTQKTILYNFTGARYGLEIQSRGGPLTPPLSDSGFIPEGGKILDTFREIIWLGDREAGLAWFAEGMKGWRIRNEKEIQSIGAAGPDPRIFRIKFADESFSPDESPLDIVFGLQATPMRPRPENFRSISKWSHYWGEERNIYWQWFWWEGEHILYQDTHAEKAKAHISEKRAKGMEVMPYSSVEYHGDRMFYMNEFGTVEYPGMKLREIMLWGNTWGDICPCTPPGPQKKSGTFMGYDKPPERALEIKNTALKNRSAGRIKGRSIEEVMSMEHFAEGEWMGELFMPRAVAYRFCPASSFQDYYIWMLHKAVRDTGLGAIYLDQQLRACLEARHGCGYIGYDGEWRGEAPIFAMREAVKRIYFVYYELNGRPPLIKWHCSQQMVIPAMSFIDIFWDGEAYDARGGERSLLNRHFYSEFMDEGVMQVPHMGKQFGFAADFLPVFTRVDPDFAPAPASVRDMMGLLMIHDSNVNAYWQTNHPRLIDFIQRKRLSYPLESMEVQYYWEEPGSVKISRGNVRHIIHYDDEHALLILFNWSGDTVLADIELDVPMLSSGAKGMKVTDVLSKHEIFRGGGQFEIDILPRDFRMMELKWDF